MAAVWTQLPRELRAAAPATKAPSAPWQLAGARAPETGNVTAKFHAKRNSLFAPKKISKEVCSVYLLEASFGSHFFSIVSESSASD